MSNRRKTISILAAVFVVLLPAVAMAAGDGDFTKYENKGWLWMYLAAFGFGFLTSLTPCVYPMIPIVVGVFGARDEDVSRSKAFILATLYVLGMGVLYAFLGLGFAMLGKATSFGSILANPWIVIPLVVFYAALAASMFGAFEFRLPMSWQNKLNKVGGKGYTGAFAMGLVGGLTAAPCTGPFLAGILGFVATTGSAGAGFGLLFTYAIGMGVLFWFIAVFAASMPKSGRWMEWVKSFGGIALLAVGLYFLRPIVGPLRRAVSPTTLFLIASIAVASAGALLGAIHLSFHSKISHKVRKGFGVALMVVGVTGIVNWMVTPKRALPWVKSEKDAFVLAKQQNKGIMIDFSAEWCAPCKELEHTFAKAGVYEAIVKDYIPLKFDVTKGSDADEERQERYRAPSLPVVLFIDPKGVDIEKLKGLQLSLVELGRIKTAVGKSSFLKTIRSATEKLRAKKPGTSMTNSGQSGRKARRTTKTRAAPKPKTRPLPWLNSDKTAFNMAKKAHKGVMIDFSAEWCAPCQELDQTFRTPGVREKLLAKYIPVKFDMTKQTKLDAQRMKQYGVKQLPTVIFFGPDGKEKARVDDALKPTEMTALIAKLN